MSAYPHRCAASIAWRGDREGVVRTSRRPSIQGGAPIELGGDGMVWSAEELLCGAIALSYLTTFFELAEGERLRVTRFRADAIPVLDGSVDDPQCSRVLLRVEIETADPAHADVLAERALTRSAIAASLTIPVEIEKAIRVAPEDSASPDAP